MKQCIVLYCKYIHNEIKHCYPQALKYSKTHYISFITRNMKSTWPYSSDIIIIPSIHIQSGFLVVFTV